MDKTTVGALNDNLFGGSALPNGTLNLAVTRNLGNLSERKERKAPLSWRIKNFVLNRSRDLPALVAARFIGHVFGVVTIESALVLKKICADGTVINYGVVGRRVVTDAGVGYIVDAFQNLVELENMKFHGFGTGTTAEATGDTALVTELTTEYVTNSTRPTGTTSETSANIFQTVATLSPDSGGTIAITEHGIFSANAAGVLLDRTKFSAVNLVANADSLQATYLLTLTSGS